MGNEQELCVQSQAWQSDLQSQYSRRGAGGAETQGYPLQRSELEASLSYKRMKLLPDHVTELTDTTRTAEVLVSPGTCTLLFDGALKSFPIILDNDRSKMKVSAGSGSGIASL